MKVLFVSSGNSQYGISPIVRSQGESLKNQNINVDYYAIKGRGVIGYLRNIPKLRSFLSQGNYDLIHSHYSLSALVATFASGKAPHVVSLMGSDTHSNALSKPIMKLLIRKRWDAVIVKSIEMMNAIDGLNIMVIPNGVDMEKFNCIDRKQAQKILKWNTDKKHILFAADPNRNEKNYQLAEKAIRLLDENEIEIHCLRSIPQEETVYWYNAADVVLLTSLYEGSPNSIKEAMACNSPIVSTLVGDIKWLFGDLEGHFVISFEPEDVAKKIKIAFDYEEGTNGRQRIMELGLDSNSVANRIIDIYRSVLQKNEVKNHSQP